MNRFDEINSSNSDAVLIPAAVALGSGQDADDKNTIARFSWWVTLSSPCRQRDVKVLMAGLRRYINIVLGDDLV